MAELFASVGQMENALNSIFGRKCDVCGRGARFRYDGACYDCVQWSLRQCRLALLRIFIGDTGFDYDAPLGFVVPGGRADNWIRGVNRAEAAYAQ